MKLQACKFLRHSNTDRNGWKQNGDKVSSDDLNNYELLNDQPGHLAMNENDPSDTRLNRIS